MRNKHGKVSNTVVIWVVALVVFGGLGFVYLSGQNNAKSVVETQEKAQEPSTASPTTSYQLQCDANTANTVTLSYKDRYNTGTTVSAVALRYWRDGVEQTVTSNTSFSAVRGSEYEWIATKADYVAQVGKFTASCDPIPAQNVLMADFMNLTPGSTTGIYCYDKQSQILNGVAYNYSITSGQQPNINCIVEPIADDYFPGQIWVLTAAQATYDEIRLSYPGSKSASNPGQHTGTSSARDYAFYIPPIDGASTNSINFVVTPMTKSGQDPSVSSDIKLTQYDLTYGVDSKTGRIITTVFAETEHIANAQAGTDGFALVTEDSKDVDFAESNTATTEFIPVA